MFKRVQVNTARLAVPRSNIKAILKKFDLIDKFIVWGLGLGEQNNEISCLQAANQSS